jgi:signal transduction histidine kinase/CheY-like chemotaxis protein
MNAAEGAAAAPASHAPADEAAASPLLPPAISWLTPASRGESTAADQVRALYQQTPASLVGNLTGAVILTTLFGLAGRWEVFLWLAAFAVVWVYRLAMLRAFNRAGDRRQAQAALWGLRWNLGTLASGALWGAAVWLLYADAAPELRIALLLVVYSYCVGSIPLLATQHRVFLAFNALCFVPTILRVATGPGAFALQVALVLTINFTMTSALGRGYRRAFDYAIELKVRAQQLLGQLRAEKAAAEEARREAEVANRAKTQFFAAASHDLRQPLHALGLFAEALRSRSHDEQVVHLVNSINSSVDALEGLFSELLDITKIDTGGVEALPRHFALADVFRKLKLHFEPTAFEKGLDLRFRGNALHAYADPVLVERVLRNLLSNAIRYTVDGSVLVSARRRGDSILLQVWDTGVGIREHDRERIFEEFYQVPEQAVALDPHQRKGLGLGLAIVKRLAGLMSAPLTLRSRVGHGTVFTLEVPVGRELRADEPASKGKPVLGLTLDRRFIVIVEDDPAVRSGLEVLLKGWGATVLSFESVTACTGWAQLADASQSAPDLVIADYRLESGHTGVEAIRGLRDRFGAKLPAIVVTGSLMTGHEREAQAHDFHLLVKPVVPNKLRAMIAFKLGVR